MTPDSLELEELAAVYLAGALPDDEANAVAARLAGEPELAAAVSGLAHVAHRLAAAGPEVAPPPAVRERVLEGSRKPAPAPAISRADDAVWQEREPGVFYRFLAIDPVQKRLTALVRMGAGRGYRAHRHDHWEECLVLEGELQVGDVVMKPGDFQRAEPGSRHPEQRGLTDCLLLLSASLDPPPG